MSSAEFTNHLKNLEVISQRLKTDRKAENFRKKEKKKEEISQLCKVSATCRQLTSSS
jgi:hypothetical protein